MITITYTREQNKIRVKGHACFKQEGSDTVCAAVSALFFTLCETFRQFEEEGIICNGSLKMDYKKGNGTVSCVPSDGGEMAVDMAFFTILSGFRLLSLNYPDYVCLK